MRFARVNAITEEAHATGLLVLHLDRSNRGHYVAAARLDDDVTLPEHCQPRLDLVNLDPASAPDLQALVGAVIAAAEDTDRQAWSEWAQQEVTAKRLAPGVAEAILQSVANTQ